MEDRDLTYFDVFYSKEGSPDIIELPHQIINHRISLFSPEYLKICAELDKNIFYKNPEIVKGILFKVIKKHRYMPKTKDVKEALEKQKILKEKNEDDEFGWLFDMICERYCWSLQEKEMYRPIYDIYFKDLEKLKYFFRFFGIDKNKYKKYGLEF